MPGKKRMLLTGGTGLLGKGFVETAELDWEIVVVHQREYKVAGLKAEVLTIDLCNKKAVDQLFEDSYFDIVIHAGGVANVDYVESNYAESAGSNIAGTAFVSSAARRHNSYLVYISTNAVFDGDDAPYGEAANVNPINEYGRIKAECEKIIRKTIENGCIVRPILMYGWNHPQGRSNPVTGLLDAMEKGRKVEIVNYIFENPLYNLQAARALWKIVEQKPTGVFHLAGRERINRYDFACKIALAFGLDRSVIKEINEQTGQSLFGHLAPRPRDTTFTTNRMEAELGVGPMSVDEGLEHMKAQRMAG